MRVVVTVLGLLVGGAVGLFGPVLVAIALNVGSTSYEAFLPVLLVTTPLCAVGCAVGATLVFSRRVARGG